MARTTMFDAILGMLRSRDRGQPDTVGVMQAWANDDFNTGVETLFSWEIDETCCYRVEGSIEQAASGDQIGFIAQIMLRKVSDGSGGYTYSVGVNVELNCHYGEDWTAVVAWADGSDDIYSDYDEASGTLRLRVSAQKDNCSASGYYFRLR